jgi:hypothetical protein
MHFYFIRQYFFQKLSKFESTCFDAVFCTFVCSFCLILIVAGSMPFIPLSAFCDLFVNSIFVFNICLVDAVELSNGRSGTDEAIGSEWMNGMEWMEWNVCQNDTLIFKVKK